MRLALAQLNFTVGDFDANLSRMAEAVARAAAARADLVVFPELAASGYPPRDLLRHARFVERGIDVVERLAHLSTDELGILVGFVDRNPGPDGKALFNAAALCHRGVVAGTVHKSLLPTYDVFDEDRYFEPARTVAPLLFKGVRLGVTICEDVWNDREFFPTRLYHRDPVQELAEQGADLFINISASPFTLDKADLRRRLIRQNAVRYARPFFYVNQVGGNDEIVFDGHSMALDADGGDILRLHEFEEDFAVCDVTLRGETSAGSGLPPADPVPGAGLAVATAARPRMGAITTSVEETAHHALVLGLRDYAAKCGFRTVVIGLSGGIDSALTACLAAAALGPSQVTGVAMPTRYSSQGSLDDAEALARTLGITYHVIPIDAIYQAHLDALQPVFAGLAPDASEENIQARVRGAILMALSNKQGSLLLTTGNKSELAVGYCTLYGDMAGGLAVISDVPKTLVYRIARFVNRAGAIIPESTLTKAPSAELRPDQRDSDSLPPYEVLDPIVQGYVEEELDVLAIAARGFDRALVEDVVRRIDAAEYKRRQAAPGIKISSKAFGVGRRYPIAANYRASRTPVPVGDDRRVGRRGAE